MTRIIGNDTARFAQNVLPAADTECHLWQAAKDRYGYGRFWIGGTIDKAHRAAWRLYRGAIPQGLWVLHRCDNPQCVNPNHLFLGDRTANMKDMAEKGRQVFQAHPEKIVRGGAACAAKLSDAQAVEILDRLRRGEIGADLAREFGVSNATVSALKVGRNWAHLHGIDKLMPRTEVLIESLSAQETLL